MNPSGTIEARDDEHRDRHGVSEDHERKVDKHGPDPVQQMIERFLQDGPATLEEVKSRVEREIRERPLVALGVASAVGFALGGGFRFRSGRKMIKRAVRYGMAHLNVEK